MKRQLVITGLRAKRSSNFALDIDRLSLSSGRILCVAGPNGSGKTTFIECLTGLLAPQTGRIAFGKTIINANLKASKALLGFIPDDEDWFIKELCAKEYFDLLVGIYREAGVTNDMHARISDLAKTLYFTAFTQPLEQLSHGNKKKVQLIAGLMHQPKVIILDELRNGLDPLAVIAAEQLVKTEAQRGACVVAATHDLWWTERMSDEVLLLVNGKPKIHDKTKHVIDRYGSVERAFIKAVAPDKRNAL